MRKVSKLTIDRAKWKNQACDINVYGYTKLLNPEGNMCCLGFLARKIGVKDILNRGMPTSCKGSPEGIPHLVDKVTGHTDFATEAIVINDGFHETSKQKERELTRLFKKEGIELTFKGKRRLK